VPSNEPAVGAVAVTLAPAYAEIVIIEPTAPVGDIEAVVTSPLVIFTTFVRSPEIRAFVAADAELALFTVPPVTTSEECVSLANEIASLAVESATPVAVAAAERSADEYETSPTEVVVATSPGVIDALPVVEAVVPR